MSRQCAGEPEGSCPVLVVGRVWCRGCTARRQEAQLFGLPIGIPTPVGIILQDIEAPVLLCECGGVADGYRHKESMLHRQWAWALIRETTPQRPLLVATVARVDYTERRD